MAHVLKCDICKNETDEIVGKLFFSPVSRSRSAKSFHNNYEMHLDVGICCATKLKRSFKWRQRMTADQYNKTRRRKAS